MKSHVAMKKMSVKIPDVVRSAYCRPSLLARFVGNVRVIVLLIPCEEQVDNMP